MSLLGEDAKVDSAVVPSRAKLDAKTLTRKVLRSEALELAPAARAWRRLAAGELPVDRLAIFPLYCSNNGRGLAVASKRKTKLSQSAKQIEENLKRSLEAAKKGRKASDEEFDRLFPPKE